MFTYDEAGRTTFVGTVSDQGTAPCWNIVSADGRFLYVSNTGSDTIGVYSLADPLHPVQIQNFQLSGPTTNSFEIAIDPTGHYLYAVTQASNPSDPQGNQLHALVIARNGTLSEPNGPVIFPQSVVPGDAHPQGLAAVRLDRHDRDRFDAFGFGIEFDYHDRDHHGW